MKAAPGTAGGQFDRRPGEAVQSRRTRRTLPAAPLLAACATLLLLTGGLVALATPAAPAAAAGSDAGNGTAASVTAAPRLARLSTTRVARTQVLTLYGSGFGDRRGTSAVSFGSLHTRTYLSWSDERIVCRVPTRARIGALRVCVVTPSGTSNERLLQVRRAITLGTPKPVRPKGTIESVRPQFRWRPAKNATSYELQIAMNGVPVFTGSRVVKRSLRPPERLAAGAVMTWRVRARRAGRVGPWSPALRFRVRDDLVSLDPDLAWLAGHFYDGGVIAHFYGPGEDPFYAAGQVRGIMVAPGDLGQWAWAPAQVDYYRGPHLSDWDGARNTESVLGQFGRGDYAAAAARACNAGGHSDWYLPAYAELIYLVRPVRAAAQLPDDWYWSSNLAYLDARAGRLGLAVSWSTEVRWDPWGSQRRVCAARQFTYTLSVGREYGGGVVGYVLEPGDPGYVTGEVHGLIVSTSASALSTTCPWAGDAAAVSTGATATVLGAGAMNTAAIVNALGAPARRQSPYAAYLATGSGDQGFSDWYLPSKDELARLHENRTVIAGLVDDWYWSSSESGAGTAWAQEFPGGEQQAQVKTERNGILFVRSF